MQVCQVCQKENPAGAEYCEDCGAALPAGGAEAQPAMATPPAPPANTGSTNSDVAAADTLSGRPNPTDHTPNAANEMAIAAAAEQESSAGAAAAASPPPAAPAAGEQKARLVAMRFGAPTGEEIPLLGQRLVVGRFDPETGPVDIDLTALTEAVHVSRQHGELYREDSGGWMVRDLGSANGVFVKGSADAAFGPGITAPRALTSGDEISFGNARFVFRTD